MFTCERISGIEGVAYMYDLGAIVQMEQGSSAAEAAAKYFDGAQLRHDNEAHKKEHEGRLLIFGTPADPDLEKWAAGRRKNKTPPQKVAEFGKSGEVLSFEEAVLMGKGCHPKTGETLIKNVREARTVGYDFQFAMPKSASVLWGLAASASYRGSAEGARWKSEIESAQKRAVERVLRYAYENGLVIARRTEKREGHESVGHIAFGQYQHFTSREGDPQVHTHNMLFNLCVREDGTTGTLDNAQIKKHGGAMAALYRMEVAHHLKETLGVTSSKVDRNFEIDGISEELIATFSKRRGQIEETAAELGIGDTASHREASKHINRNTRKDKSKQPALTDLYGRWELEAASKGWRFETVVEAVSEAAEKKERIAAEEWAKRQVEAQTTGAAPLPAQRPDFDMDEVKARAYSSLVATNSVFEERRILKEVFEELQVHTNVDTAVEAVDALIKSGDLIPLSKRGDDLYFTTAEIVATERAMLRDGLSMKGNLAPLDAATVDRIIKAGRLLDNGETGHLRDEQKLAVLHLCGTDQLSIVQGRAGAGKSFMLATVADINRTLGREVHAIAPSHRAKEVVADDAKIAADMARAVAGFINDYEREKITVGPNTTILVDEAGMVGLDDMKRLVEIAKKTGARMILSGDTRQLQPVAKGAPMAALSRDDVCGAVILGEIVRQKVAWQRAASVQMSSAKLKEGLAEYVKHGRVKFSESAKDDILEAYMKDLRDNPSGTRSIGVFRNAHATELNLKIREALKEEGVIAAEGYVGSFWTRGMNQRVVNREFCEGDRIIFGESLKIGTVEIANNTTARVDRIAIDPEGEPTFTITTDDGRTFKAKPSEMVGYRDEDAKDKTTPKIDHAYAATVHSLQGATVDRMFVYAGEAGSAELAYVMMTRHKLDCHVFVDKTRIHDELAAQSGKTMFLSKKTGGAGENNTEAANEITDTMIQKRWLEENAKSSAKLNACDFHDSIQQFLSETNAKEVALNEEIEMQQEVMPEVKDEAVENATKPNTPSFVKPFGSRPMPRGLGQIGRKPEDNRAGAASDEKKTVGEQVRERMEQRAATHKRKPYVSQRITQDDMDAMVRTDLADYLQKAHGFSYVEAYTPKSGSEAHILRHEDIGKVSVKKENNGVWKWVTRAGDASGLIWDYEVWRSGGTKIEAMHKIRNELGWTPTARPSYSPHNEVVRNVEPVATAPKTMLDRIKDGGMSKYISEQFEEVRKRWNRMVGYTRDTGGVNAYLEGRGIDAETQRRFKDQIGTEHRLSRQNPHGLTIAHRDLDGNVWNYERKGPKHDEQEKRDFSQMGAGTKRLGLLGDYKAPTRFYVSESAIDGLSLFQHDGRPKGAVIVSTFGNPSDEGLADLYRLAKENPKAEFHLAMDNDKAGKQFTEMMQEVVQLARGDAVDVVDRRPDADFKDWNDQVRGKKWDQADKKTDERREAILAEDRRRGAEERAAAEAERRRRKEEREAEAMKGPRR